MQEKDEIKLENKAKKSPQIMAATIGESVENVCLNRSSTLSAVAISNERCLRIKQKHFQGALEVGSRWELPWLGPHLLYPT